ncbi:MAG: DNA helicase II [Gammaproteobacteria bacterium]
MQDDVSVILNDLNDAQRAAVTAPAGHTLVLAGAGSGKTRVLVHRIAWLVQVEGVSPYGILAVTFTNKAAGEMRGRIEQLLDMPAGQLWVGTFHGLAHRLLRMHWKEARLPQGFQILDSEDQLRQIKRVIRALDLDEDQWQAKPIQWFINARKDEGKRPASFGEARDPVLATQLKVWRAYEQACERSGAVDFAELLLRCFELFREHRELLDHYRRRFAHVLVDEFQDTNTIQYDWIRLLTGDDARVFIVGDDDQSIYGWRGARVGNIFRLEKDFPGLTTVRLEQNYRSTGTILAAANALIARNTERLGKNLWTDGKTGDPVRVFAAFNEREEAGFVIDRIRDWVAQGGTRNECAILYRSNAQSRVFEEALISAGMPYRVYGGLRFFERQEIKDALAYLRLTENRHDDSSYERVVNLPTRGVGARTIEELRAAARERDVSLWQASQRLRNEGRLTARAAAALEAFHDLVEGLARDIDRLPLHEQVDAVVRASGLIAHYEKEKGERGEARIENLEELVSAARGFDPGPGDEELPPLSLFLAHAALEAGESQGGEWDDCVQLMTLHSAKGLEYPLVFLCGLEDGLFPHQRSILDPGGLEEERRLCYVGMTRAMKQLYLTWAESRRLYGTDTLTTESRFIAEIPVEHLEEVRARPRVSRPVYRRPGAAPVAQRETPGGLKLGQRVRHSKFGEGVVLNFEGDGEHARVQVNFRDAGTKWLVLAYANLSPMA